MRSLRIAVPALLLSVLLAAPALADDTQEQLEEVKRVLMKLRAKCLALEQRVQTLQARIEKLEGPPTEEPAKKSDETPRELPTDPDKLIQAEKEKHIPQTNAEKIQALKEALQKTVKIPAGPHVLCDTVHKFAQQAGLFYDREKARQDKRVNFWIRTPDMDMPFAEAMTKLLRPHNLDWTVRDGRVLIGPKRP